MILSVESQKGLNTANTVPLRTTRVLLLYKFYGISAHLVLSRTFLNSWFWAENLRMLIYISSVENQKGAITIHRCSIENQKGAIAIDIVQR